MAGEIIEFNCRPQCPYSHECGESYKEQKRPCVDNITSFTSALNASLEENPILDPERPQRSFSLPWIGEPNGVGQLSINAQVRTEGSESERTKKPYDTPIGYISHGLVVTTGYDGVVYKRVKNSAPVGLAPLALLEI